MSFKKKVESYHRKTEGSETTLVFKFNDVYGPSTLVGTGWADAAAIVIDNDANGVGSEPYIRVCSLIRRDNDSGRYITNTQQKFYANKPWEALAWLVENTV